MEPEGFSETTEFGGTVVCFPAPLAANIPVTPAAIAATASAATTHAHLRRDEARTVAGSVSWCSPDRGASTGSAGACSSSPR